MGFPNVDMFLVSLLKQKFAALKAAPDFTLNDLFDDLSNDQIADIKSYIAAKTFSDDIRDRKTGQVHIVPHHPLADIPLPQIGISLGNDQTAEEFLNDNVGDATPYPETGTPTHWDIPKGYWAQANYQIDVVAATKPEAIWLSRFVQRFICEEKAALDQIGVKEIKLSLSDSRPAPEYQPMSVFNRTVQISCKVANRWTKRIPASAYASGNNTYF